MKFKVFFAALLLTALSIPQAQGADTGWRYWGYFQAAPGATAWTPAMTGPTVDVADGAVEGWASHSVVMPSLMQKHQRSRHLFLQFAEKQKRLLEKSELA